MRIICKKNRISETHNNYRRNTDELSQNKSDIRMINAKIGQKSTKLYRTNQLLQKVHQKLFVEYRSTNEYYKKKN